MNLQERRERIIKVAHNVDAARSELTKLEAELDSLLGQLQPVAAVPFPKDATLPDRIVAFLKANPGTWDANTMLPHVNLKSDEVAALRSTLARLASEKRISKHSRGKYMTPQKADVASNSGPPAMANGATS
jgi:hypothetical protein